ncbi:MAG: hypothetical protein E6L07_03595 [Verrucomicrobia bacterium]|nr:MAG: hypothetical protein E6L07_03595 [Verrucomicrobiota bacterium]
MSRTSGGGDASRLALARISLRRCDKSDPPGRSFPRRRGGVSASATVAQAVAFVERIRERTGKYPGLYCSEYRLRQMLYGPGVTAAQRRTLGNCWLWIANYHFKPRNTAPWDQWHLWQYCGDGKCDLPRSMYPKSIANIRRAERNIFRGDNGALQLFWQENAWFPTG